jgi:hypothetical protein
MSGEVPPRVLIHGMQSSGASLLALLAAQGPDTLAVIDLWNPELAPDLAHDGPIVLKTTTGPVPLAAHVKSFRPTAMVLMLRHPVDQISVLTDESFRDYASPLEDKLEAFDNVFADAERFDAVVSYEQFTRNPTSVAATMRSIRLPLPADANRFPRSLDDVVVYAREHSPWCDEHWRTKWGTGRVDPVSLPLLSAPPVSQAHDARHLAREHCPALLAHYS